ncbi:uncharacterized protein prr14 [Osmerus mordax]|uniref:uncharacterized protein prr14 n=1 Tax=Osmerus mordax TaxID=8014 RepID=UPI00350E9DF2
MTEKETNNNDSVPCKRSRSSINSGPESTELNSPSLSSQPSDDTGASCESKLKPNIQLVGLAGAQRKPSRRKRHVSHKSTTKSGSSKIVSSDMPCNSAVAAELHSASRSPEIGGERFALKCDSQSTTNDSKDAQSSVLSSVYYTPPDSMCSLDDSRKKHTELHGNHNVLVCVAQSHISVKNSPEKTSTDNGKGTAPDMGDSFKPLPQQVEESEGKREVGSTKRERKLKVTALTDVERNVEKRKRVKLVRGEECKGQLEREGLAGVESCTLASLDHKEHLEYSRPRMLRKQGSAKSQYQKLTPKTASSTTVDVVIQELPETITAVIKKDKGNGRKGHVKLNVALPAKATTSTTDLEDPTVMKSTDSLTRGNPKGKRNMISKEQECFSSTKRLKQQKNTCYSHSESGSMEPNTTPMVKPTLNDPSSGGFGQDTKGRSETSRTLENVYPKNRNLATDEMKPSRNGRKCCTAMQSDPSSGDDEGTQSLPCGACPQLAVKLNKHAVQRFIDDAINCSKESMEEVVLLHSRKVTVDVKQHKKEEEGNEQPGKAAAELRRHVREHRKKPRKAYNQRRRRRALSTSKVEEVEAGGKGEEMHGVSGDQLDAVGVGACSSDPGVLTRGLLRRHSCPEILSLLHHDSPWNASSLSPHRAWTLPLHRHPSPHAPHPLRSSRRARRHTVCSVEVEREIAPLCLRKEVYPTRRCSPYGSKVHLLSPSVPLSPSISLSAQASRFLSSPLAFLSRKMDKSVVASSLPPSVFTSSSPSCSSLWHQFPGSNLTTLSRSTSSTSVSSLCNALSQIPLEGESETRQQSDDDDGEDTSCSSQEFESMGMREEKALSDSEIKMGSCKNEERGKVSSIRIRKTLPKPQKNLTPMGLPRPVRLKKKEFSLEEIYTNQNFTKPPEGRLETIFELPLNRRNGSQSLIGQKRLKRFVEFPEVGVARKPRKSLVGAGKVGMTSTVGRPRRGNVPNSKDDPPISLQDIDSLLCSKLDELDYWLVLNQETS